MRGDCGGLVRAPALHGMRGGEDAVKALDRAYSGERVVTGAMSKTGIPSPPKTGTVSHFTEVELLRAQHGEAKAPERNLGRGASRGACSCGSNRRYAIVF
jgi:hypothetical protein